MALKTIKDIREETWAEFKSVAARNGMKMGKLFENMFEEYKKRSDKAWKVILSGKKILSDKEAEDIKSIIEKSREEYGFRT